MPALTSLPFPSPIKVCMALLGPLAAVHTAVPDNWDFASKLIVVRRIGGVVDDDGFTDNPIVQVQFYAPTYLQAEQLASDAQVLILSSPLTMVDGVLVDDADIYVGEQEVPDIYPDERRLVSTYRFAWRRQFRPGQ